MEKRIDLERRGKPPSQVIDLNLDNSRATHIEGLNDEYLNLETLSLIGVGLTSLKGFPKLPKLRKLELSENRVSSGLESLKDSSLKLTHLNLSNNKIKDLNSLTPLTSFQSLTHLDLFNNEVCKADDYRKTIFNMISSLKVLDGFDLEGNEVEESDLDITNGTIEDEEDDEDDDEDDGDEEEESEEEEGDEDEIAGAGDSYNAADVQRANADDQDDDDQDEDEDEEDGPGLEAIYNLSAIYNDKLGNEDDDKDYSGKEEEEDDDLEEEDELEDENNRESDEPKVKRRKVEEEDEKGKGGGGKDVPK